MAFNSLLGVLILFDKYYLNLNGAPALFMLRQYLKKKKKKHLLLCACPINLFDPILLYLLPKLKRYGGRQHPCPVYVKALLATRARTLYSPYTYANKLPHILYAHITQYTHAHIFSYTTQTVQLPHHTHHTDCSAHTPHPPHILFNYTTIVYPTHHKSHV